MLQIIKISKCWHEVTLCMCVCLCVCVVCSQWLQVMAERALSPDSSVPPPTRGTLWSDTALAQLADLAATHDTAASGQDGGGGAAADTQQVAARAAAEVLVCVLTDPRQGLIRGRAVLDAPLLAPAGAPAGGGGGAEGVRRALRLLARLRPAVHALHASVLRGAASGYPALAAEYISSSTNMSLDPMVRKSSITCITLQTCPWRPWYVCATSTSIFRGLFPCTMHKASFTSLWPFL